MKKNVFVVYLKNIIIPCLFFSLITGLLTGAIVVLYKYFASEIIDLSQKIYSYIRFNPILLLPTIIVAILIAFILKYVNKFAPDAKGGGIANAIAFLRGLVTFKWFRTLIGVLFNSLLTFLVGTPLGNEGPSVLTGTAVGRGVIETIGKKNKAWTRYIMTGGASAGFAAATNAPIAGVLLALEEAHHRLSPMLIMVSGASVCFSIISVKFLSSTLGISADLFESFAPIVLELTDLWIPVIIGLFAGAFSVFFTKYVKFIRKKVNANVNAKNRTLVIFFIFFLTIIFGAFSQDFIGTGHHLIEHLLNSKNLSIALLICIFAIRFFLTTGATSVGITGGTFVPTLAFGAIFSSILSKIFISLGLNPAYHQVIILLGMCACISGSVKTPLTAIVFAFEALSLSSNVLSVAIVCVIAYIISEIFCPKSVNDEIMEIRVEEEQHEKTRTLIDATLTVQENSFAVGKQIRDILWPNNTFVLSIKRSDQRPQIDEHGEKNMYPGDILHVRFSTHDEEQTRGELLSILGAQDYEEKEWNE